MSNRKKVLLIVNPKAGQDKARINAFDVVERLSNAGYDCTLKTTACAGDATNLVKKHIDGHDMVVCCGGDGTLNETINGIMALDRRVPVGYIPNGSTNDLANTIGIPSDIKAATDLIVSDHKNGYDIGLFNNKFFSYVASFGPATNISYETPQYLKNMLGHSAYMINALVLRLIPTLKSVKPMHIRFEYDGGVIDDTFFFGAISNATSVGGIFKFDTSDVLLDDGVFEVLLVRKLRHTADAFKMLHKIQKMDYDGDTLIYLKTTRARFTFDKPVKWTLDGEFGGEVSDVRVSVLPHAIDIISPENPMFLGKEPEPTFVREETVKEKKKKSRHNEENPAENTPAEEVVKEKKRRSRRGDEIPVEIKPDAEEPDAPEKETAAAVTEAAEEE